MPTDLHSVFCQPQAMAAYRTAARLFPGLHTPLLGMGMEYQRMNNLHLAEQMFLQARSRNLGVATSRNASRSLKGQL